MRFPYRASIVPIPDSDDVGIILRPEIPVVLVGPRGQAAVIGLVDTGADTTIFPKHLAERLGIVLQPDREMRANAFGGAPLDFEVGEAQILVQHDGQSWCWKDTFRFFDDRREDREEFAVLGHAGFLDYFTATFDGKDSQLILVPNDLIPANSD